MNKRKFLKTLVLIAGSLAVIPSAVLNLFKPKEIVGELGHFEGIRWPETNRVMPLKDFQKAQKILREQQAIKPITIDGQRCYAVFANEDWHKILKSTAGI